MLSLARFPVLCSAVSLTCSCEDAHRIAASAGRAGPVRARQVLRGHGWGIHAQGMEAAVAVAADQAHACSTRVSPALPDGFAPSSAANNRTGCLEGM